MAAAFDDLEPCTLFPSEWGTLAVGWLTKDRPYAKGTVALELMRALQRLTRECELCPPGAWVRALAPGFVEETGLTAHEDVGAMHVDVGLGWRPHQSAPNLVSLVNFGRTSGGSHEEGLLTALRQAAERRGSAGERVLAGPTAVVHVGFDHPWLEGERAPREPGSRCRRRTETRVLDAAPWWWDRLCEVM